jgi:hypothetical protein
MSGTNESLLQANITLKKYHKIHKRTFLPLFGRHIILKDNTVNRGGFAKLRNCTELKTHFL